MLDALAAVVLLLVCLLGSTVLIVNGSATAVRRRAREVQADRDRLMYALKHVEAIANSYKDVDAGAAAIAAWIDSEKTKGLY